MTLTEFLLARITETESLARQAIEDNGFGNGTWLVRGYDEIGYYIQDETRSGVGSDDAFLTLGEADHIAYHDPNRVLAECEAKRQIVEQCRWALDEVRIDEYYCRCETANEHEAAMQAFDVLRALASVYADHPDFQEEWKP